jgi:hypothetical protein
MLTQNQISRQRFPVLTFQKFQNCIDRLASAKLMAS